MKLTYVYEALSVWLLSIGVSQKGAVISTVVI